MTPLVVEATYENGVLKPTQALPLNEHDKVRLTVETLHVSSPSLPLNLASVFDQIEEEVGLFDGPADMAAEHDHYLYGAAKADRSDGG